VIKEFLENNMLIKCPHCGADNVQENNYCVSCHQLIRGNIDPRVISPVLSLKEEEKKFNDGHVILIIGMEAIIIGLIAGFFFMIEDALNSDFGLKTWIQSNYGLFLLLIFCFYILLSILTIIIAERFFLKKENKSEKTPI